MLGLGIVLLVGKGLDPFNKISALKNKTSWCCNKTGMNPSSSFDPEIDPSIDL